MKMLCSKKSQMVGQVFVYSLSLLIVAIILMFGYDVINKFLVKSCTVEMLQFHKGMESYIDRYSSEYGSTGNQDVFAPCDAKTVCFVDFYSINSNIKNCNGSTDNGHTVVRYSFQNNPVPRERKNMFLLDKDGVLMKSAFMGNVTPVGDIGNSAALGCNYICIDVYKGSFNIGVEGRGVGVKLYDTTP